MLSKKILNELEQYINEHLVERTMMKFSELKREPILESDVIIDELESFIKDKQDASFAEVLFHYIDKEGLKDADVYKKVGLDRRHFSKIRSNPDYQVSKPTAISLAIALELNEKETEKLLHAAGFSLTDNHPFDLVIQFCINKKIYDIDEINQALDYLNLKTL
ncbi:hypothetical protein [Ornithinibacillus halophilus]|uniref:NPH3 family protein n=1 Tax=Ornithinibacillus halophilus TaxID=930117 RepID=A0A1M5IJF9_9BACI|nr:hypothetical protein [Ornithinibacillus halophilus]SHG28478.1 hypothetical protein SAMN05216225_102445 [Ornithinibacillus halophilus]